MKKLILITLIALGILWGSHVLGQTWQSPCAGKDCFKAGVEATGQIIGKSSGIITGKGISEAVQDVIKYFLTFLTVIAVIYVMYAGAQMLLNPASEESSEKTKKIIISVFIGIAIIWFAWWIVSTIFYVLNSPETANNLMSRAVAETQVRNVDFTTYSNKIRAQKTRIAGGYSPEVTNELTILIDGAYDHLPDRAEMYVNRQLYDSVKKAIRDYDIHREEIDQGILENAIDSFLEQTQTFQVTGEIDATPNNGDAPLSVTLEGKNVIDGSGTLIADNNYIWWFRTPNGPQVIGRGKTINHIFQTEGTYTVYLTVNSSSKNSRGFIDVISFEDQVTIEVGQPKVNFLVYFNDQLATTTVKIPTIEANKKVFIDATQTKFSSGYTVAKTEWSFGNTTVTRDGAPIIEAMDFNQGEHTIRLTLTRNDGEVFSKNISLKVGDPIASISVSNVTPNKGDNVVFQAKKVTQEGVQYGWEVRKVGIENPIYTSIGPRLEYAFREIGRYSVTLTSNKGDVRDKESVEITIDSRPPVVRFSSDIAGPETPNIFLFDATATYDPDYPDERGLKYEWFINDQPVSLSETNSNNSRGTYIFPEIGTYQVELQVTDKEGKRTNFKKTIAVQSLLSIRLAVKPLVARIGEKIIFAATAPNAEIYEWNWSSGENEITEIGRAVKTFQKAGIYTLTLKVTDKDENTNSIQKKIYITNSDVPFAVPIITTKSLLAETQANACDGHEALIVDRVNPVTFTGDKSTNVGGKTTDLTYFWRIGLNQTSTQKNFSHTFDEIGCEEISLTVTDKKTGATSTSTEWVKVVNIAPRFSDIDVNIENIDQDPMKINLRIEGARDPDGAIRSYTWYYYTAANEEEPQGFRITTKPETSFTLPKINGRYYFSVIMEDSSGLRVDTRKISEDRYSTPDLLVNQNIATPVILLSVSSKDVKYGEPVTFTVNAQNALGQDIGNKAEYRWDVDGDGFYDTKTLEPTFTYTYTVPGEYHPKVKVTHRGISTTKFLTITVTNKLLPKADIQIIGNRIVAYNTSQGLIQSVTWFADDRKISDNKDYLVYTPPEGNFPTNIKLQITDGRDTESVIIPVLQNPGNLLTVKKITRPLVLLGNVGSTFGPVPDTITWDDPTKTLFLYTGESTGKIQYYAIDTDLDIDTDLSGGRDDDADNRGTASYKLGRPFAIPIGIKRETDIRVRLIGTDGKDIDSRVIKVVRTFIAEQVENPTIVPPEQSFNLSVEDKARLDQLNALVKNIPEAERAPYTRYVDQLGDIWYDRADRAETLLQFSRELNENANISGDLKTRLLEQINLIYTEGEQAKEDRDLAIKMVTDFLSKSPGKKEIFGDNGSSGLMGEIIDNPEYYEQNKAITDRIYEEYVQFDTSLSDDAKALIRDKLNLIAGKPPVVQPPQTPGSDKDGETLWTKITSGLGGMGSWIIWVIAGLIGLVAFIWIIRKIFGGQHDDEHVITPRHDDQLHAGPDWLQNDVHNNSPVDNHTTVATPTPKAESPTTPDWLKSSESPFGEDDVFAKEDHSTTPSSTPDWLKEESTPAPAPTPVTSTPDWLKEESTAAPTPTTAASTPDWLKEDNVIPELPKTESEKTKTNPLLDNISQGISTSSTPLSTPASVPTESSEVDVPDWLKGSETATPDESKPTPSWLLGDDTKEEKEEPEKKENSTPVETTTPSPSTTNEDIPEWLRGADTAPVIAEEVVTPSAPSNDLFGTNEIVAPTPMVEEKVPEKKTEEDIPDWLKGADEKIDTPEKEQKSPESSGNESQADDNQDDTSSTTSIDPVLAVGAESTSAKTPKKKSAKKTDGNKVKKVAGNQKLLSEGDHLIEPAHDLLADGDNSTIQPPL